MSEEHYSIKEMITEFRSDVKGWIGELSVDMKQTKEQAFKTNGRLLKAEETINQIPSMKDDIDKLKIINAKKEGGLGWFKQYILPIVIAMVIMVIGQMVQTSITKKQIETSLSGKSTTY